jgi:hypothetical protein
MQKNTTWKTRIRQAKKNGYFSDTDLALSDNWRYCAVGEVIEQKSQEIIEDVCFSNKDLDKLRKLGHRFTLAVENNYIEEAEECYNLIKTYKKENRL